MLYDHLISNISYAKVGPLFYLTLTVNLYITYYINILYFAEGRKRWSDIPIFWFLVKISPFLVQFSTNLNFCDKHILLNFTIQSNLS